MIQLACQLMLTTLWSSVGNMHMLSAGSYNGVGVYVYPYTHHSHAHSLTHNRLLNDHIRIAKQLYVPPGPISLQLSR